MEQLKRALSNLFPLDIDKRLIISSFCAGVMTTSAISYGPINISNPLVILAGSFLLQAIILVMVMNYEKRHSGLSSWLVQTFTLGPLGLVTGVLLIAQLLPVAKDSVTVILIGAGLGLIIAGVLNIRQGVIYVLNEKVPEREDMKKLREQKEHEQALITDFLSALNDPDSEEKGRAER